MTYARLLTGIKSQIKRLKITLCIDITLCAPTFAKLNFYCVRYCCTNSTNMLFVALKLKPTHYILSGPNLTNNLALSEVAQVFSCEFCGTSKNTFLQNTSRRLLLPCIFSNYKKMPHKSYARAYRISINRFEPLRSWF